MISVLRPAKPKQNKQSIGRYSVIAAASVRAGERQSSKLIGTIMPGQIINALETSRNNGKTRLRCEHGWISVVAGDGTPLLEAASEPEPEQDDDGWVEVEQPW